MSKEMTEPKQSFTEEVETLVDYEKGHVGQVGYTRVGSLVYLISAEKGKFVLTVEEFNKQYPSASFDLPPAPFEGEIKTYEQLQKEVESQHSALVAERARSAELEADIERYKKTTTQLASNRSSYIDLINKNNEKLTDEVKELKTELATLDMQYNAANMEAKEYCDEMFEQKKEITTLRAQFGKAVEVIEQAQEALELENTACLQVELFLKELQKKGQGE